MTLGIIFAIVFFIILFGEAVPAPLVPALIEHGGPGENRGSSIAA